MAWYLDVDPRKIQFFKAQLWVCSSEDFDGQHLFHIAKLAWRHYINEFHHGVTNTNPNPNPNQKTNPQPNPKTNPKTNPQPNPKTNPKPNPKTNPKPNPNPKTNPIPNLKTNPKPNPKTNPKTNSIKPKNMINLNSKRRNKMKDKMMYCQFDSFVFTDFDRNYNDVDLLFPLDSYGGLPGNALRCSYEGTLRDLMMYNQKSPKKLFYQLVR